MTDKIGKLNKHNCFDMDSLSPKLRWPIASVVLFQDVY